MSKKYIPYLMIGFFVFLLVSLSFYIRLNIHHFIHDYGFISGELLVFFERYSDGRIFDFFYRIEYPVGFVIIQKIVIFINNFLFNSFDYQKFVISHAVIMLPLAVSFVLVMYHLGKRVAPNQKVTIFYLLLSPTFFIASTQNYDLFSSFFTILAAFLLIRKRLTISFVLLAMGVVIKLYPALLLPIFVLFAYSNKFTFIQIGKSLFIFTLVIALMNLPFLMHNFYYWATPYVYQSTNGQKFDPNTISYYLGLLPYGDYLRLLLFIFFVSLSWLLSYLFYRRNILTEKNFLLLLYFSSVSIVVANQLYTPQYLLWILPFVAIVQLPSLLIWLIFDFINSLRLFFGMKLLYFPTLSLLLYDLTLSCFLLLYLYLLSEIMKKVKN